MIHPGAGALSRAGSVFSVNSAISVFECFLLT